MELVPYIRTLTHITENDICFMDDYSSVSTGIWPAFLFFGVLQGLLITVGLLVHKNGRKFSNRLLAFLLFIFSLHLSEYLNIASGFYQQTPHLIGISVPFIFLIGPVFYLYTVSLLQQEFRIDLKQTLHFAPSIFCYIILLQFYILPPHEKSDLVKQILSNGYVIFPLGQFLILTLSSIQMLVYFYVTHSFVREIEEDSIQKFSNPDVLNSAWFKQISLGFSLYMILFFVAYFQLFFIKFHHQEVIYVIMFVMSFFVHAVGFNAIRNPKIFARSEHTQDFPKYRNTAIPKHVSKAYAQQLFQYMETSKPFLNSELKLNDIANALGIEPYQLSQVINSEFNKNFFDFVNEYRVEEAKSRILGTKFQHYTLLAIALDVGFNNKSSFNRVFKKHTNTTPSSFIRLNKASDSP